jgi:hypothetical protein
MSSQNIRLQIRRDTYEKWINSKANTSAGPLLVDGEMSYDTTNNQLRIGNGKDIWVNLPFFTPYFSDTIRIGEFLTSNSFRYAINLLSIDTTTETVRLALMRSTDALTWAEIDSNTLPSKDTRSGIFTTSNAIRSGYKYRLQLISASNADIAHSTSMDYTPTTFTDKGDGTSITLSRGPNNIKAFFSIADTYLTELYLHFYSSTSSTTYSNHIFTSSALTSSAPSFDFAPGADKFIHGNYFYAELRTSAEYSDDSNLVMTMADSGINPTLYSSTGVSVTSITNSNTLTVTIGKDPLITYSGTFTLALSEEDGTIVPIATGGTGIPITSLTQTVTITTTKNLKAGSYIATATDSGGRIINASSTSYKYSPISITRPSAPITFIDSNDYKVSLFSNVSDLTSLPLMDIVIYETTGEGDSISSGKLLHSASISSLTDIPQDYSFQLPETTYFTNNNYYTVALCYRSPDISGEYYERIITSAQIQLTTLSPAAITGFSLSNKTATVLFNVGTDTSYIPYSTNPVVTLSSSDNSLTGYGTPTITYTLASSPFSVVSVFSAGVAYKATIVYAYPLKEGSYSATISGGVPVTSNLNYSPFSQLVVSTAIYSGSVTVLVGPLTITNVTLRLFKVGTTNAVGTKSSIAASNTFTGFTNQVDDDFYADVIATGTTIVLQTSPTVKFNVEGVDLTLPTINNNNSVQLTVDITDALAADPPVFTTDFIYLKLYDKQFQNTLLGTSTEFTRTLAANTVVSITPDNPLAFAKTYVIKIIQGSTSYGSAECALYSPVTFGTIVPYDKRYMKVPLIVSKNNFSNATVNLYRTVSSVDTLVGSVNIVAASATTTNLEIDLGTAAYMTLYTATYVAKIVVGSTVVRISTATASISGSSFIVPAISYSYTPDGGALTTKTTDIVAYNDMRVYYKYPVTSTAKYPNTAKPTFKIKYSSNGGSSYTDIAGTIVNSYTRSISSTGYQDPVTNYNTTFITTPLLVTPGFVSKLTTAYPFIQGVYYFELFDYSGTSLVSSASSSYAFAPLSISGFSYGNYYKNFILTVNDSATQNIYTKSNTYCAVIDSTASPDEIISNYTLLTDTTVFANNYGLKDPDGTTIEFTNSTNYYVRLYYKVGTTYYAVSLPSSTLLFRKASMTITGFAVSSFNTNRTKITYTVKFTNTSGNANTATVKWYPTFVPLIGTSTYGGGETVTYNAYDSTFTTTAAPIVTVTRTAAQLKLAGGGNGFEPELNTTYTVTITLPTITEQARYHIHGTDTWSTKADPTGFPDIIMTPVDYYPTKLTTALSEVAAAQGSETIYNPYLSFTYSIIGNSAQSLKFKLTNTDTSAVAFENVAVTISAYSSASNQTVRVYHADSSVAQDLTAPTIVLKVPTGSPGLVDDRYIIANTYKLELSYSDFNSKESDTQKFLPPGYDIILLAGQSNMYGCDGINEIDTATLYDGSEAGRLNDIYVYSLRSGAADIKTIVTSGIDSSLSYNYSPKGAGQNTTPGKAGIALYNTVSMGQEFVRYYKYYILQTNRTIIVIPSQKGNTGFTDNGYPTSGAESWFPGATDRNNVLAAIDTCIKAKYPTPASASTAYNRMVATLWHQGEFDAQWGLGSAALNTSNWVTNLNGLITSIRGKLGDYPTFKFILGELEQTWALGGNKNVYEVNKYSYGINSAIIQFDDTNTYAKSVSSHGLHGVAYGKIYGDYSIHYSNRAQRLMGARYMQAFLALDPYTRTSSLPDAFKPANANAIATLPVPSGIGYADSLIRWYSCSASWLNTANAAFYIIEALNSSSAVVGNCVVTEYVSNHTSAAPWDTGDIPFSWESSVKGCWVPGVMNTGSDPNPRLFPIKTWTVTNLGIAPADIPGVISSLIVKNANTGVSKTFSNLPVYPGTAQYNTTNSDITNSGSLFYYQNYIRFPGFTEFTSPIGATQIRIYAVSNNYGSFISSNASAIFALP